MQVQLQQIIVPPGQQLLMTDISWKMYEQLLEEYSEKRGTRINYSQGILEIMVSLPEHEDNKVMIADFIKVILEEWEIEFRRLGSTTFKSQQMLQGLEADDCFSLGARSLGDCESPGSHRYIENEAAIRGKKRLDLTRDPSPDLAIEIDITSRSRLNNYEALGVGELWRFDGTTLEINVLQAGRYVQVEESLHFPNLPLLEIIPQYLEQSKIEGRNKAMKAFRAWVKTQIEEK